MTWMTHGYLKLNKCWSDLILPRKLPWKEYCWRMFRPYYEKMGKENVVKWRKKSSDYSIKKFGCKYSLIFFFKGKNINTFLGWGDIPWKKRVTWLTEKQVEKGPFKGSRKLENQEAINWQFPFFMCYLYHILDMLHYEGDFSTKL